MIKKYGKGILLVTLCFGIIYSGYKHYDYDYYESKEIVEYKLNATNTALFNKIKTLQDYATSYVAETSPTSTVTDLCLQFVRKDTYSDAMWNQLLGEIDTNFVTYVAGKNANFKFTASDKLIDEKTNIEIDFIHLIAALTVYKMYGEQVNFISTDYSGWAGDLMTLLAEVVNYRITNNITDNNVLTDYAASVLATNKPSSFGQSDAFADLDAINIHRMNTLNNNFHETLLSYYSSTDSNNVYNRFATARNILGSKEILTTKANQLLSNTMVQQILIPTAYGKVTATDTSILASLFASYVYEEGYIKLNSTSSTNNVGDKINVGVIEKHMQNATLTYDTNIISASLANGNLSITCKSRGETTITIKPQNGSRTATYTIKVNNIAPAITKNLDSALTLTVNEKRNIAFTASGTNNTYTWYLSKDGKSKTTLLGTTNTPNMDLVAKTDMNGKYIVCFVKNDGNNEISTTAMKLTVNKAVEQPKEDPKEDKPVENPGDNKEDKPVENPGDNDEDNPVENPGDNEENEPIIQIPPTENPKVEDPKEESNGLKNILSIVFGSIMGISLVGIIINLITNKKKGM